MLVLVSGDAHIPNRSIGIPERIRKLLVPGKISQVVNVGNIYDADTMQLLQKLTPRTPIISVLGTEDIPNGESKTSVVFNVGKVRVGVISSFEIIPQDDTDSLASKARQLDVDLLLWGSCRQDTQDWAGHYFITPGSLTGAATASSIGEGATSSDAGFCLLDINDIECTVFMYKLNENELRVEKAVLPINRSND